MVECCWTAASSSLSKMVHSPMVMDKWPSSQKKRDLRGRPLFLQRTSSSSSSSSSQDGPGGGGGGGYTQPLSRTSSLFWPLQSTWPLFVYDCVCVCDSVLSWACPAVLPFLVEERCCADCLPPPFSLDLFSPLLPPSSPVRWCLSSPCRTTLFCATAYAIAHCMTAMISLSFPLASLRPVALPLFFRLLSLPSSSTLPPGHSLYFTCTDCHQCCSALVLALCRIFAFAAPLLL